MYTDVLNYCKIDVLYRDDRPNIHDPRGIQYMYNKMKKNIKRIKLFYSKFN